jgi:transposase-like protein
MAKAPGRSERNGITVKQLMAKFNDEATAMAWFESKIWPDGRKCPRCGNTETVECGQGRHPMPYRCHACNRYFSVRIGTILERSHVSLQDWAIAIYMHLTSLKGVSSMKLHRDLGVTQKTAWFMLQRIRRAFKDDDNWPFGGPVEVDETNVGGKRRSMSNAKRKEAAGRGPVDMSTVIGAKDRETNTIRAKVIEKADAEALQGFIRANAAPGATVYTDEAAAYKGMHEFNHETVNHSVSEFVRGMASTNGIESFWATLKRAHKGIYHKISPKHLSRYVADFAARHGARDMDTLDHLGWAASMMRGKRLTYAALIADNGLSSGARA